MSDERLNFTGERFLPECEREIWYEHMHRYAMIAPLVQGRVVLDAACGEGYGSQLLSQSAASVNGVDIDSQCIELAQKKYTAENLSYHCADVLELPFDDGVYDVVVSFETLEHLAQQDQLLKEFHRVLKDDGLLIISTPDKAEYTDKTGHENAFHVKELYHQEFLQLVGELFPHQRVYGQRLMFGSMIWALQSKQSEAQLQTMSQDMRRIDSHVSVNPMYLILLAGKRPVKADKLPAVNWFSDAQESVYQHYNDVVKEYMYVAKAYDELHARHQRVLQWPILGRLIGWLEQRKQ